MADDKILKVDGHTYIKPEAGEPEQSFRTDHYYTWGWRWNKNAGRYGTQCIRHVFKTWEWVDKIGD